MYSILICDDEKDIVNALKIYLTAEGYETFEAYNGQEAIEIVKDNDINLVLLDVMMPVMDGITALSLIRNESNIPIILLTAKSEDTDKILGLNIGADDYITKPFNPVEVCARVRSQLRRYFQLGSSERTSEQLVYKGLAIDNDSKSVTVDGADVTLTPTEFNILRLLMKNIGKVYPPKEIYREVWNDDPYGCENTIAVHIRHIREKTEIDPSEPRYVRAIFGQGYMIGGKNDERK